MSDTLKATKCSSGGSKWLCSFRLPSKYTGRSVSSFDFYRNDSVHLYTKWIHLKKIHFNRRFYIYWLIHLKEWWWLTWSCPTFSLPYRSKLLRTEWTRHSGTGTAVDASKWTFLWPLTTAFGGDTRLPRWWSPNVEGVAVAHIALLQIGRSLGWVAPERNWFRIDPFVSVNPMTGHSPMLDSGAARVRTFRPIFYLPRIGTSGFVASATWSWSTRFRTPALVHPFPTLLLLAINFSILVSFAASFGTLHSNICCSIDQIGWKNNTIWIANKMKNPKEIVVEMNWLPNIT